MLKKACRKDRNFAFYYAQKKGYKHYIGDRTTAGDCTFHYISVDDFGVPLGYVAFYISDNMVYNVELVAYEITRTFFKDLREAIDNMLILCSEFYLDISEESPSLKIVMKLFKEYGGHMISCINNRAKFYWCRGGG